MNRKLACALGFVAACSAASYGMIVHAISLPIPVVVVQERPRSESIAKTDSDPFPELAPDAAEFREVNVGGDFRLEAPWMPLDGIPQKGFQVVEWTVGASVSGGSIEFLLRIRSLNAHEYCWRQEAACPITLIGDQGHWPLSPCERSEHFEENENLITSLVCRGGINHAAVLARATNPRLVFGPHVCSLGPRGARACRELVRRAVMLQYAQEHLSQECARSWTQQLLSPSN